MFVRVRTCVLFLFPFVAAVTGIPYVRVYRMMLDISTFSSKPPHFQFLPSLCSSSRFLFIVLLFIYFFVLRDRRARATRMFLKGRTPVRDRRIETGDRNNDSLSKLSSEQFQ